MTSSSTGMPSKGNMLGLFFGRQLTTTVVILLAAYLTLWLSKGWECWRLAHTLYPYTLPIHFKGRFRWLSKWLHWPQYHVYDLEFAALWLAPQSVE